MGMLKLLAFCTVVAMVLADGKCPNENWRFNTTLCQKLQADNPPIPEILPWDYCCELEVPGLFKLLSDNTGTLDKLTEECFAKNDDHGKALVFSNGVAFYGVDSVFCELKTVS